MIVPGETKTKKGYFWAYCGDDQHRYSVYDFTLSHCRDGPAWWLRGYGGYTQRQEHAVRLLGQFHDWLLKTSRRCCPSRRSARPCPIR